MTTLPEWPRRTIAVLVTVDPDPHAIPVSAPVRAGDDTILLSLHRTRDSLARLRERPEVALLVLAEGDVAFTARGTAQIVDEPMAGAPDYAAVQLTITDVDDHRQAAFTVAGGVDRNWVDDSERRALGERVATLQALAGAGR
jgi:hypothetical protein